MNTRRVIRNNIISNLELQIITEGKLEEKLEQNFNNHLQMSLTQEQLLNALKVLKPEVGTMPTFSGKLTGITAEDYISKTRKFGMLNELEEKQMWNKAIIGLTGSAEDWFDALSDEHAAHTSWSSFKSALIERFSTSGDDPTNHQLFLNRKMKSDESFDEFSEAVDKILKTIRDKSMIPESAVVSTMSGNLIPKYKNLIAIRDKNMKPKSREELAGLVKNYEQALKYESGSGGKSKSKVEVETNSGQESGGRVQRDVSTVTCFGCKQKGHYQSACPKNGVAIAAAVPSTSRFSQLTCFTCNEVGHISPNCPKKTSTTTNTVVVKEEKKVRMVSNSGSEDFSVVAHVGDVRVNVIVDSGAHIHCMSEKFYKRLDADVYRLVQEIDVDRFRHATGGKLNCVGIVNVPVEINEDGISNVETNTFHVITNLIDPILIGRPNISSVQLSSGVVIHNVNAGKRNNVRLAEAVSIGPQSYRMVRVVIDEKVNEKEIVIEPVLLKQGVVARSITNEDNMVTNIINPTSVSIHIPREEIVGLVEHVAVAANGDDADRSDGRDGCVSEFEVKDIKILVDYPDDKQVDITKIPGYNYVRKIDADIGDGVAAEVAVEKVDDIPEILSKQVDDCLTENQRKQLEELLMEYPTVFAANTKAPSFTSNVEHVIDTGDAVPVKQRSYRTSHAEQIIQSKEIEEMLQNGIIRKSNSEWSSPVVMVTKRDGSVRFCIDYRRVNHVTRKDSYPLPRISEVLDVLQGAKYFSTIDFASGYWQIKVREEDVGKTAFVSREGLYEFVRMPFGLANAPATFQRTMDVLLTGLNWKMCLVYIDDIMVFSGSFQEHLVHLREVFERLRQSNFTIKLSKCYFGKSEAQYLGHIVSRNGVKPDPMKIAAVENFSVPQTLTDVRSFLGIVNYYHRFVPDLGTLAEPLYYLMKKNVHFSWNEQCQAAFEKIKILLVSSPTLRFPDFTREFIICCDASDVGLGVVLSQVDADGKEYVVSYGSRALSKEEKNYTVSERECLAVIFGVTSFRCYLHGRHFTVYTDHGSLQWLLNLKDANGRLARWALKLQGHDLTIKHRAGRLNGNADALSRDPIIVCVRAVTRSKRNGVVSFGDGGSGVSDDEEKVAVQVQEEVKEEMKVAVNDRSELLLEKFRVGQIADAELKLVYDYLKFKRLPTDSNEAARVRVNSSSFMLDNELLFHIWYPTNLAQRMDVRKQLVVPVGMRQEIMVSYHDTYDGGHFGSDKTFRKLRDRYYWSTMYQDVDAYCKSCSICQARKVPRRQREAALLGTPVADHAFHSMGVDVVGPLPKTRNGNQYIVTFTCSLTRWGEAFAVEEQKEETIAELLVCEVCCRFGCPKILLSDRGANFLSALCTKVYELMKIKKVSTTSYHPAANGITERFNGVLVEMLSMYAGERDWDTFIPYVLSAYRSSYNSSIQETPYMMVFGRQMVLPTDAMLNIGEAYSTDRSDYADEICYRLKNAHERAKVLLNKVVNGRSERNAALPNPKEFNVGDMVMLRCALKKGVNRKLNKFNWLGPYRVVERLSLVNYRLDIPTPARGNKPHEVVHVGRLKQWFDADATAVAQAASN